MAGVVGIEPTHVGVKVRCLTTWLHPNTSKLKPAHYIKAEKKSKYFCAFCAFHYSFLREFIFTFFIFLHFSQLL